MNVKIYNQEGAEVGAIELSPEIFGIEPNEDIVHQYIVNYLARQRQGNADTKNRHEVNGGGKKLYRQKGTGQARAGTIRSPLRRGGGIVFGPTPRLYGTKFPKQMKRLAIKSVFSAKAKDDRIKVLDRIDFDSIKTKNVTTMLNKLALTGKKCIILDEGKNEKALLSFRNLQKVSYCRAAIANGYDLLNADYIVLTKAGLEKVHEVFA